MIKKALKPLFLSLGLLFGAVNTWAAELPTEKVIQAQIDEAKKAEQNAETKVLIQHLEETQALLQQISKQRADNEALDNEIQNSRAELAKSKQNIERLKTVETPSVESLAKESLARLRENQAATQTESDKIQENIAVLNTKVVAQNTAPDKAQAALTEAAARRQAINTALANTAISEVQKTKLSTELVLLDEQSSYNQNLLRNSGTLATLYQSRLEEKKLEQQTIQTAQNHLQQAISDKLLEETKNRVEQAAQSQKENLEQQTNPLILKELDINTRLSRELLEQTAQMNALSQDNLRIKSVLDNLQQTRRNIEEQISSLQGTLVLSRIINKQKQMLPQDQMVKGLSKKIADLRVNVFDISEFKDTVSDPAAYIAKLENDEKITFDEKERTQLTEVLQSRSKTLSELIRLLNNQLNLSINIELNQKQVQTISDTLEAKLQQQSFWVKSNGQMDWDWFVKFIPTSAYQLDNLRKKFNFSGWRDNAVTTGLSVGLLLLLIWLISNQKEKIKQRLTQINNSMKTVATDSQWNTPKAIVLTLILCLRSTFMFFAVFILVTSLCFQDPFSVWPWGLKMAGYWLYFAFLLAMLRPNGIGFRHFNMPQKSNELFRSILRRSVWIIGLLLNTAIFSNTDMGISYDVIGQVMTIVVLLIILFITVPGFGKAISTYQDVAEQEKHSRSFLLTLVRGVLVLAPVALIVLVALGYYYTALVIIEHLISTYFAVITWIIVRNMLYRIFAVSSRRLAYRRLQEKREQAQAKAAAAAAAASNEQSGNAFSEESVPFELREDSMAVSEIKTQMLKVVDFALWIGLALLMYWVWSDLITVAYYLKGVTLWQQSTTTEAGTVMESITLLNLLIAIIIITVTYVLVRNLSGLLEALVFSNVTLSQGTPYTITTLLTYALIVLGASFAFATLGVSWTKLQWLFTALSVGLGFGMQEIFGNFVSGVIILFERPVRIGDVITIGNFSGTVSKIRIRATTLVDFDAKEVIVPNKVFITERVVNWGLTTSMTRLVISVGVAYGSDLELVKRLLLQAAEENESVLKDPSPVAYFLSFGDSTLNHELRVHVGQIGDRNRVTDGLNRRISQLFAENNIEIAFNQLDVFVKNMATNEEVKLSSKPLTAQN